jgi:lipoate-protein ligase A
MGRHAALTDLLDLTLPDAAANLALDEALLDCAEDRVEPTELLRLWESQVPMVVIGRASKVFVEVEVATCRQARVPIFRRCSGGTAVVAGPGCLMYSLVLSTELHPELRSVDQAHRFVMQRLLSGLAKLDPRARHQGTCDLTLEDRKFSGNSLRCKRRNILYHGTVLYDFPLETISEWLATPPRQPDYRAGREHQTFLTNFAHPAGDIRAAVIEAWNASRRIEGWPQVQTEQLVERVYSQDSWNFRL